MDPAQAMLADIELPGIIANDDGVAQETMGLDAAPQGAFGGDQHGVGGRDGELFEVRVPGRLIGEAAVGIFGQLAGHIRRQRAFAHIGERRGIDDPRLREGRRNRHDRRAAG
jgi:hypothetical protein